MDDYVIGFKTVRAQLFQSKLPFIVEHKDRVSWGTTVLGNLANLCFGQFYSSRIDVLQIALLLGLVSFESVSLMRKNMRGLRENM